MENEIQTNRKLNFRGQFRQLSVRTLTSVKTKGKQNLIIFGAMVVLTIVFFLFNTAFLDGYNITQMAKSVAPYAILALGVTFVIATGVIDLSIGTVCIASATIGGYLVTKGMNIGLVIPVMLLIGAIFGLVNGLLVAKFKLPAFIATLGTMMLARGLSAIIVNMPNIFFPVSGWYNQTFSSLNGFPIGLVWVVALAAICFILMYRTKVGRYILAIGSNEEAARLSGVNTDKFKIVAFTICGLFAGIAGIFWSAANPTVASGTGNGMELDAIAGVYIGGTSASGGIASVVGSVIGSLILVIIRSGLNFTLAKFNINVNSTYLTYVITGIVVVVAVLMDVIKSRNLRKVKTEKKANSLKSHLKDEIESVKVRIDYIKSGAGVSYEQFSSELLQAETDLVALKRRLSCELPGLIEQDRLHAQKLKETKLEIKKNVRRTNILNSGRRVRIYKLLEVEDKIEEIKRRIRETKSNTTINAELKNATVGGYQNEIQRIKSDSTDHLAKLAEEDRAAKKKEIAESKNKKRLERAALLMRKGKALKALKIETAVALKQAEGCADKIESINRNSEAEYNRIKTSISERKSVAKKLKKELKEHLKRYGASKGKNV